MAQSGSVSLLHRFLTFHELSLAKPHPEEAVALHRLPLASRALLMQHMPAWAHLYPSYQLSQHAALPTSVVLGHDLLRAFQPPASCRRSFLPLERMRRDLLAFEL